MKEPYSLVDNIIKNLPLKKNLAYLPEIDE